MSNQSGKLTNYENEEKRQMMTFTYFPLVSVGFGTIC